MPENASLLVVQHQDNCTPALFADWLVARRLTLDVRRPYAGDALPADVGGHAGLLVLGGAMGAHDDATHPWLTPTKALVRQATDAGAPVLAICLGHQLAAVAFGGTSTPNPRGQTAGVREIGWREEAGDDPLCRALRSDIGAVVAHWNSDVVTELPTGATVLATTDDGFPQVMRLGRQTWGVQFHPEVDHAVLSVWADDDRDRTVSDGPDVDEALQEVKEEESQLHATGRRVAEAFADVVLGRR
ncbi:MAG TPA: type 1 glutamine amidotransferase [Nocardioidaceae bacterium]|nr:type 1 glutamine amidotransferase [Nocardioidaceae bacterium]